MVSHEIPEINPFSFFFVNHILSCSLTLTVLKLPYADIIEILDFIIPMEKYEKVWKWI